MHIITWLAAVLLIGTYISGPVHDVDLWWHIAAGRWIHAQQAVPYVDYWNAFAQGKPWVAYSWSFEWLVACLDLYWGDTGLYAGKIICASLLTGTLAYVCGRLSKDWGFGLLLGLLASTACYNHFTLRPQSITWILFALLILISNSIRQHGFSLQNCIGLFLCAACWANLHLTQAFVLLTVFLWIFDLKDSRWMIAIEACVLAFIATLCTPYGGSEWLIFFAKTAHPAMFHAISEFQPATILQYPSAFLLLIAIVLLYFVHKNPRCCSATQYAFAALFTLAGLAVVKFLPFALIANCLLIAVAWNSKERIPRYGNLAEGIEKLRDTLLNVPRQGLSFLLLVLAFLNIQRTWSNPVVPQGTPVAALDFIENENLPHPLLHDFGRGGYVAYRFSSKSGAAIAPVSIDGRTNVTPKEMWLAAHEAFTASENWEQYFSIVKPETVLWRNESPLVRVLLQKNEWCRVYQDGSSASGYSIFLKYSARESRFAHLVADNC